MKKPMLLVSLALAAAFVWSVAGFYAGFYLSDYDPLCERHYATYAVNIDLVSNSGIRIPAGSTVLGRSCEKTIGLTMRFAVDLQDRGKLKQIMTPDAPAHQDHVLFAETRGPEELPEENR